MAYFNRVIKHLLLVPTILYAYVRLDKYIPISVYKL
jgi:hypothetical protein